MNRSHTRTEPAGRHEGCRGARPQRSGRTFTGHSKFLPLLLVAALFCLPLQPLNASPDISYTSRRAVEFADALIGEQRYDEAAAFLRDRISASRGAAPAERFELIERLARVQIQRGRMVSGARWVAAAESLRHTEKQGKRLSELQQILTADSLRRGIRAGRTVETAEAEPGEQQPAAAESGQPTISNSFYEMDVRNVLSDLSMESGVPIRWDNTVQGLVTYDAFDIPLEKVLDDVLSPLGYVYSRRSGTYYVGSSKPTDPAFLLLSETEVVHLANIEARAAIQLLSESFAGYVKASEVNNTVCITAPTSVLERIREDLEKLDEPPVQLAIEVVVAEISSSGATRLGLNWSGTHESGTTSASVAASHTTVADPALSASYLETATDVLGFNADLMLELQAMVESGEARIRANPRITTLNGRTAEIGLTKDEYFIIQTGGNTGYQYNTLQSVSSGIKLEITPLVAEDGEITVLLQPEVGDVIGQGNDGLPTINTRSASTSVRVRDGETFSIGGLSLEFEDSIQRKIPLLGSIPWLGALFRYTEKNTRTSEVVIFVTPDIVRDEERSGPVEVELQG